MIEEEAVKKKPFLYCFSAEKFQEISGPRRKSGEKPHYMVEVPRRDGICGGWSSGKRFGIIDRQKVHPPGFLAKVYKGGIVMKGKKKLLSVLLAAALVGQMGVVVGMGTAEDDCAANEHGRKSPVATACSESVMHWIKPVAETLAIGGNGKNIFYVSAGDSITCGAGKNIIVVEKSSSGDNQQVEINNFGLNDGAVPAATASGRSVSRRITRTGFPRAGASSWSPPESVMTI